MLGLLEYEFKIQPKLTGKPYKPYYKLSGDDLVIAHNNEKVDKIVPFPSVAIDHEDNFQNLLDSFLCEIGYVEYRKMADKRGR